MADPIVSLRPWQEGDVPSLVKYANNYKIWLNVRDSFPYPYTESDAEIWIKISNSYSPPVSLAIQYGGEAVGGIGITIQEDIHHRSAEVGYWLGEKFWGKGIMTLALKQMLSYALENFNLCRIYAGVFEYNKRSGRVLEKAGFALEGVHAKALTKNKITYSEWMYAFVKED